MTKQIEQARIETLRLLLQQNYFKKASCTDIANTFLEKNGLPILGQTSPVTGARGNFDRSKAAEDPPIFSDEVSVDNQKTSIAASSIKGSSVQWQILISRKTLQKTPITLSSTLSFGLTNEGGNFICNLQSLAIKSQSSQKANIQEIHLADCLDYFLMEPSPEQKFLKIQLEWIKKDCANAIHYSKELKKKAFDVAK